MKAFQLKITLKHSKPPIWRRIIVPAGITFSQLSMILNKAMGWDGEHLFDMEFPHQQLRISEDVDEFVGWGDNDYLEASTTFIREFLEENKNFNYTYDFGDNWEHKVTVEKILEDYELNYPKVIKFKGNCPPEDCGGIYSYYYLLDRIENKANPEDEEEMEYEEIEYEDDIDWLEYLEEYDMDKVNEELEKYYFYKWGKGEKRSQYKIFEDHFKGKYGLNATKKDKNKDMTSLVPGEAELEKELQRLTKALEFFNVNENTLFNSMFGNYESDNNDFGMNHLWEEMYARDSMKEMFEDYLKTNLVEIAKDKGLKGVSKYKKDTLIEKLIDFMLKPEVMEWYFSYLTDKELEAFEILIDDSERKEPLKLEYFEKLYMTSYVGMFTNGVHLASKEVKEAYQLLPKENLEKRRKKNSFLLSCLRAASILYGIAPLSVLLDMIKTNSEIQMTEQEIRNGIENMPSEFNEYIIKGDKIYHKELYPDDKGLLAAQGGKEYYIPTKEEILDLGVSTYLPESRELKNFVHFLTHKVGIFLEHAEYIAMRVQVEISSGCEIQDVLTMLEEEQIYVDNDKQLEKMMELLMEMWNHTRMLINRGFTPSELSKKGRSKLPVVGESNVVSFEERKKNKIYPNDSCPCGSGKKYKNCCGKK